MPPLHLLRNPKVNGRSVKNRRGGMTIFMALIFAAVATVCMMTINIAYIEMARTDLQTATDLAVKSAASELGRTQNTSSSQTVARTVISRHVLANGRPLQVSAIEHGAVGDPSNSGRYSFIASSQAGTRPRNAIRIQATYPRAFGESFVPFPTIGGTNASVRTESISARTDIDLVLCLDRSASMAWGLTDQPFLYPNGTKGLDNYFRPPDEDESRWAATIDAVETMVQIVTDPRYSGDVHLGLVTYASTYDFGLFHSDRVTIDLPLSPTPASVLESLRVMGTTPIIGDTNMDAGLSQVQACLTQGAPRAVTGVKVLILLTDGLFTEGESPTVRAATLRQQGWTIHTISFSAQADRRLMARVAQIGGGLHFHAPDRLTLDRAFREIAFSLPATLIQ